MTTRRKFVLSIIPAFTLLSDAARTAAAQGVRIEEKDPIAISLGYVHDATKPDTKKSPAYATAPTASSIKERLARVGALARLWAASS